MAPPNDSLHLERIRVRRLYGIEHDGVEIADLSAGINVVFGPNGRGKTTLARSVQRLLWPDANPSDRPFLDGRFALRGHQWDIELEAGTPHALCDGRTADWVAPTSSTHRDRYFLALHDLLRADDEDFAKAIMKDAVGGLDLSAAADELDFRQTNTRRNTKTTAVEQARQRMQEVKSRQASLYQDQKRLETLRDGLTRANAAEKQIALRQQALVYRASLEALRDAEIACEAFPARMAQMRGDEAERLAELATTQHAAEASLRDAEAQRRAAEAVMTESPIPDTGLPPTLLSELKHRLRSLKDHEQDILRLQQELASARKTSENTWAKIIGHKLRPG